MILSTLSGSDFVFNHVVALLSLLGLVDLAFLDQRLFLLMNIGECSNLIICCLVETFTTLVCLLMGLLLELIVVFTRLVEMVWALQGLSFKELSHRQY